MKTASSLDRLLRAAATVPNESPNDMPFGFDTRVLALVRASDAFAVGIAQLFRRVVFISLALIVLATAGAWRELQQADEPREIPADAYAIADSAIGGAVGP